MLFPEVAKDHRFEGPSKLSWNPITRKRRIYVPCLGKLKEKMTFFPGLLSFTSDGDSEWLIPSESWHLSHKTVGRTSRAVWTSMPQCLWGKKYRVVHIHAGVQKASVNYLGYSLFLFILVLCPQCSLHTMDSNLRGKGNWNLPGLSKIRLGH